MAGLCIQVEGGHFVGPLQHAVTMLTFFDVSETMCFSSLNVP